MRFYTNFVRICIGKYAIGQIRMNTDMKQNIYAIIVVGTYRAKRIFIILL